LKSWHVEEFFSPVQFATPQESRRWVRLTFREILADSIANPCPRPGRSLQLYPYEGGKEDEQGCVGEGYENPDRDEDHSLTMWLMSDFARHLDAAPPLPSLDYLRESFGHLLDLPAWDIRGPHADEPWPEPYRSDEQGQLRGFMVVGRTVPSEFLDALTHAGKKLLEAAPADWTAPEAGQAGPAPAPESADRVALPALDGQEPDGPFEPDGFRFRGIEVRFGRAGKQLLLVLALWDAAQRCPRLPREIEHVMTEVYGEDHDTSDPAFRQLCSDTRRRLEAANLALAVNYVQGKVWLSPQPA
jgi:hypothetical protein